MSGRGLLVLGGLLLALPTTAADLAAQHAAALHADAQEAFVPAPLFSDGMVLQAGMPAPVWGRALPGAAVMARFGDHEATGRADDDGRWRVDLPPLEPGDHGELELSATLDGGERAERVIGDVLVGEVWFCSGQSNMEWPLHDVDDGAAEIAAADHPRLRLFRVGHTLAESPAESFDGCWQTCSPESVREFSALAYLFGRELMETLDRPVGLVLAAWGGTPVQSWTPIESLRADPDLQRMLAGWDDVGTPSFTAWAEQLQAHNALVVETRHADPGRRPDTAGWEAPGPRPGHWQELDLPGRWEDHGLFLDGAVWLRREVTLPLDWEGRELVLTLGPTEDADVTWLNGVTLGATASTRPSAAAPRRYDVPSGLAHGGVNTVAVRVFDRFREGGFGGEPEQFALALPSAPGEPLVSLAGTWHRRVEWALDPSLPVRRKLDPSWFPSGLYNGMVAPAVPFAVRGVAWYQGEANTLWAHEYRRAFPTLITAWRQAWGREELPFVYVQLANFQAPPARPGPSNWAELREAQALALERPATAMAVAIDVGEADDIHPGDKQTVARRLARAARAVAYGHDISWRGPTLAGWQLEQSVEGSGVLLRFHLEDGPLTTSDGGVVQGFAMAGADREFRFAEAVIRGDAVLVRHPQIPRPVAVRYAWSHNPPCNLVDTAGLPAAPFRTDDWPLSTVYDDPGG